MKFLTGTGPEAGEPYPEDAVPATEPWSAARAQKDCQLMAEGHRVLEGDGRRPAECGAEEGPEADE
jgi:hypothetical protein